VAFGRLSIPGKSLTQCFQCGSLLTEFERSSSVCAHCFLQAGLESRPEAGPDDSFGSYAIICQIGQGGMGIVYLAEQQYAVHREVALKVLKAGLDTAAVLGRFETERQALALMEHPNIARLYDAGKSSQGRPYFVMEFVDGPPITTACDQHGCSVSERLALFVEVCHAIEHAHRKGIVHRDIKPSNVLVTEGDGHLTPKVIDFGIARAATGHLTGHTVATGFGELLGTPEYMSPEQAGFDSRTIGPRSDIYSLGVLLYELLAGVLPFDPTRLRESGLAETTRIIREEEAPSPLRRLIETGQISAVAACRKATPETLRRVLSRDLARILRACLQKDPKLRYPSAAALAGDIGRYLQGEPLSAQGPTLRYRTRQWLWRYRVALGGISIAALTAALVLWLSHRPSLPVTFPTIRPLTSYTGAELEPSFSPDGKQLAFVWDGGSGNFDIYVRPVDGGSPVRLTYDRALDLFPAWSPDGKQVAFIRVSGHEKALYVVPARGGGQEREITSLTTRVLGSAGDVSLSARQPGPAWSADGKSIVVADNREQFGPDALYEFPLDGSPSRKLTSPEANSEGDSLPAFSPDGRTLAFVRTGNSRGSGRLYVFEHGSPRLVLSQQEAIDGLSWLSNQQLVFSSSTLWRVSVRGGAPSPILGAGRGITSISYSPQTGGIAYAEQHLNTNVWRLRLDRRAGATPERLLFSSLLTESADYSPDGRTIVFVSNRSGQWQLWSAAGDGTNPVQLTPNPSQVPFGTPRWSPDAGQIVYDTVSNGHSAIGIMNRDGTGAHILANDPWDDMMPSWSHDGQSIYFTCNINSALKVCRKPVAGGTTKVLTNGRGGSDPRESPDGRFVFYAAARGIWKVSVDGGGESAMNGLEDVDPQRYWTIAGKAVYFLRDTLSPWAVYRYDLETHRISAIAKMEKEPVFGSPSMSVSPDLQFLLFSQVDERGTNIVMLKEVSPNE
jgi:serine/threonine protein kinase/Tol biopolymer transport system component